MAEGQHKILRQGRAGGRLDSQIENLRRSLEIVGVCPYGTVVIALYKKLQLFQDYGTDPRSDCQAYRLPFPV